MLCCSDRTAHRTQCKLCIHNVDSGVMHGINNAHAACYPRLICYACCAAHGSNVGNPISLFKTSVALAKGLEMGAAYQCPLMTLSGLVPCLLLGLEPVFSSPWVMFSIKLM